MKALLDTLIPEFSVRPGWHELRLTSPSRASTKPYGIRKTAGSFSGGITIDEMIFVGDALFPGGNDYPAKEAGAVCIAVKNPHDSKRVVETIIACLGGAQDTGVCGEEKR